MNKKQILEGFKHIEQIAKYQQERIKKDFSSFNKSINMGACVIIGTEAHLIYNSIVRRSKSKC